MDQSRYLNQISPRHVFSQMTLKGIAAQTNTRNFPGKTVVDLIRPPGDPSNDSQSMVLPDHSVGEIKNRITDTVTQEWTLAILE